MPRRKAQPNGSSAAAQPTRRSSRGTTQANVLPKRSPYFEHPLDDGDNDDYGGSSAGSTYEDGIKSGQEQPSETLKNFRLEPPGGQKPRKRIRTSTFAHKPSESKKRVESGETFIPYKMPSPGETEFVDDRIHPTTVKFLKALAKNNNRPWFAENNGLYRAAKSDFESFVKMLSTQIINTVDDTIPELPVNDLIFRLHRDIRFSNDLTPYKVYFSAAWSRTGRKGPYASYYLSVQPGQSFVGGGLWQPAAQPLGLLRRSIDRRPERLKQVLAEPEFAEEFCGEGVSGDERKAVKEFTEINKEGALKTAPKNYPKDHRDIELLRLRSFTVGKRLSDEEVTSDDALARITNIFRRMEPLIRYLNNVVMPDINTESSSGEDGDTSGEEDSDEN